MKELDVCHLLERDPPHVPPFPTHFIGISIAFYWHFIGISVAFYCH
jgi:hypothetical protein